LNLVNVHLFHDASNLIALTSSPSIYSENRKKALIYTLDRIKKNQSNQETEQNIVIFGDFNFRLDLSSLVDVKLFIV
jgi:inositol-1,4,5-trisphosphate 5-phosphatase